MTFRHEVSVLESIFLEEFFVFFVPSWLIPPSCASWLSVEGT